MDKRAALSLDAALDEGHLKGAVAYKKVAQGEYVLVYQHPQKTGVYFGTSPIHCYEFELGCLALDRHVSPARRTNNGHASARAQPDASAHLVPARPRRIPHGRPEIERCDVLDVVARLPL